MEGAAGYLDEGGGGSYCVMLVGLCWVHLEVHLFS